MAGPGAEQARQQAKKPLRQKVYCCRVGSNNMVVGIAVVVVLVVLAVLEYW